MQCHGKARTVILTAAQGPRRRLRGRNPAYASSSLSPASYAPTSYLAPSQYYKLGRLSGVNGGRFAEDEDAGTSFSDSVNQRVVGTRFQEVHRNSMAFGRLPLGSHIRMSSSGLFSPVPPSEPVTPIPDPSRYGPNYVEHSTDTEGYRSPTSAASPTYGGHAQQYSQTHAQQYSQTETTELLNDGGVEDDDWVDLMREAPIDFSQESPQAQSPEPQASQRASFRFVRRPKIFGPAPSDNRDTFTLRTRDAPERASEVTPPHLRVQRQPPFVRPLTGLDHDDLGTVYADIRAWRTRLKTINQEIGLAQAEAYNEIADGVKINGWLMIGRGLRFVPGVQLIEGRAKEDVRWDLLQGGVGPASLNKVAYWTVAVMSGILLAVGRKSSFSLATFCF